MAFRTRRRLVTLTGAAAASPGGSVRAQVEDHIDPTSIEFDHDPTELLGHTPHGATAAGRSHRDEAVAEFPRTGDDRSTHRGADAEPATIRRDRDVDLAGTVEAAESDDPTTLHRCQAETFALGERSDQRWERLRVRRCGRSEVARLCPKIVEETFDVLVERGMIGGDDVDVWCD